MDGVRRVPGRPLVVFPDVEQVDSGRQVRRHHRGLGIIVGLKHDPSPLRLRGEYYRALTLEDLAGTTSGPRAFGYPHWLVQRVLDHGLVPARAAPYSFNQLEIGLFALAGAAGALLSAFGGGHIDARPRLRWLATGVVQGTLLVSYVLIAAGGAHLGWLALALLVTGVLFMDATMQSSNLLGQSVGCGGMAPHIN
jgi:hypothetical protein